MCAVCNKAVPHYDDNIIDAVLKNAVKRFKNSAMMQIQNSPI